MTGQGLAIEVFTDDEEDAIAPPTPHLGFAWFEIDERPEAWDREVRAAGQGMFHLSQVLAANASSRARRRGIVVQDGSRTLAVLGGLWRKGAAGASFQTLSFHAPTPQAPCGWLPTLIAWLHRQGIADFRIGSFDGGIEHYGFIPDDCTLEQRLEFIWSLDQSHAERTRMLRSNHKRKLKNLLKRDLRMKEVTRFRPELMTLLRVRWAQRRGREFTWRKVFGIYRFYRRLESRLTVPGLAKLYGLHDEHDRVLSIAYMLETPQTAFYMVGASGPAGYRIGASVRLFADLAELYASRGLRYLNLGGVPDAAVTDGHDEHGVYRFKSDFGVAPTRRTGLVYQQQGRVKDGDTHTVAA